jgi:hypothetical protein
MASTAAGVAIGSTVVSGFENMCRTFSMFLNLHFAKYYFEKVSMMSSE